MDLNVQNYLLTQMKMVQLWNAIYIKFLVMKYSKNLKTKLQWCAIEMQHLLCKPYVNEVTLNGQNIY